VYEKMVSGYRLKVSSKENEPETCNLKPETKFSSKGRRVSLL
jgi:hypothetical protein